MPARIGRVSQKKRVRRWKGYTRRCTDKKLFPLLEHLGSQDDTNKQADLHISSKEECKDDGQMEVPVSLNTTRLIERLQEHLKSTDTGTQNRISRQTGKEMSSEAKAESAQV